MTTFVLVHGAMHGGWCWDEVVPHLSAAGHVALAPDLPGLGGDATTLARVDLAMNGDFVAGLVQAQPEPVVLVGHSMGGVSISEAAERVPDRILGLVYLAAMLLPAGERVQDPQMQSSMEAVTVSPDGLSMIVGPERAVPMFYNRTEPAAARAAARRLTPQPLRPAFEPLTVTAARFGRVPRAYVECLDDQAIPIDSQRRMQAALPCDPVVTLDTDHSPFLNMPQALARSFIEVAEIFAARRR
jgi:pimeloyl-ACP methyl ester carboxylesterase